MPKSRWSIAAAALALGLASACLQAASPFYPVNRWTTAEGLPQSSVFAVAQTKDGYLWLGTGKGLARFDGIRFKVYDGSTTPELDDAKVVKLFEDRRGNLWIGTDSGRVLMVESGGQVNSIELGKPGTEGPLAGFGEDQNGGVWLRMARGQLYRYLDGRARFTMDHCVSIATDEAGLVWIGTPDGRLIGLTSATAAFAVQYDVPVGRLDMLVSAKTGYWRLANGRIQKCKGERVVRDLGTYPWKRGNDVVPVAACEDAEGNLFVATYGDGVYWFDSTGKPTQLQGLYHTYIWSLATDREGSIWVGTDGGGLSQVRQQVIETLDRARYITVQSVCEDSQGGLWYGINNGGVGLFKNGKVKQIEDAPEEDETRRRNARYVRSVLVDKSQNVWAGTDGAGLFWIEGDKFRRAPGAESIDQEISALYQDRAGKIWAGTRRGLSCWNQSDWKTFTTRDGLPANAIRAIAEDQQGDLWIGTADAGISRMRGGKFETFNRTNGLPSDHIFSLCADPEGNLWAGTSGGLARYTNGKWFAYPRKEEVINHSVGYLLDDGLGYLWMGSTAGLMRVDKKSLLGYAPGKTLPLRLYGPADGLPDSECTSGSQPAACRTREGILWFPTIKGLASVNPKLLTPNSNAPIVRIENVWIDGQLQNSDKLRAAAPVSVTLPAGSENLEIGYASLNLSAPTKGRFKYQLEGFDKTWIEREGTVRFATYTKLPPDTYAFHVAACNEDGVWNEKGARIEVKVLPPFWRTWWFITGSSICLLGLIVGSVHYVSTQKLHRQLENLRQKEALEKERARIARDLHDQLGANLTQVTLLAEMAESDKELPEEVEAHAKQICQTARETTHALDEIVWTVNPSNDTLDGLINYICKYAQEYLELAGLRYRLEVPPELPAIPISPELRHNVFLAAKESVNNVVKHSHATAAWLRLILNSDRFILEIEDNGRGVPADALNKGRSGLRNMRKRMEDIGGEFDVGPGSQGGAKVRLIAPLQKMAGVPSKIT